MRNIYFAVAIAAFSIAFSACSDDKSDPEGACYIAITVYDGTPMEAMMKGSALCMEGVTKPLTKADCTEGQEEFEDMGTVTSRDSCPDGGQKCLVEDEDGIKNNFYLYGPMFTNKSCEELENYFSKVF